MKIKSVKELSPGDVILINGMEDNQLCLVTVERITRDQLIIPKEFGGLDYAPENPKQIVCLSEAGMPDPSILFFRGIHNL